MVSRAVALLTRTFVSVDLTLSNELNSVTSRYVCQCKFSFSRSIQ